MNPPGGPDRHFRPSRRLSVIGVVVILVILLTACLTSWNLRKEAIAQYRQDIKNLGMVLAEQTTRSMQAVDLVLQETQAKILAAQIDDPQGLRRVIGSEELHRLLAGRAENLPQAGSLGLIDADGKLVNGARTWPTPDIDLSMRDYYQHFREHDDPGVFISAPVVNRLDGAWSFFLARRLSGLHGEFLGVVLGMIDIRYFEEFFQAIALPGGSVAVVRRDGTILTRYPHVERMMGERVAAQAPFYEMVADGGGSYRSPGYVDGVARIVSVHPLRDLPLVVVVTLADDAALAGWRRQSLYIAIGACCSIAGFAVLFAVLGAQFRRLERSESSLAARNLDLEGTRAHLERRTTELAQTATALRQSEARFRDFALMSSDWFWEQDAELRFCRFSEVSGKSEIETAGLLGKTRWEVAGSVAADGHWALHQADLAARRPFRGFCIERAGRDGKLLHLSINGNPLFDEAGTFLGYRGTGRDVTAEVEAEARLRHSEERFRQLFEAASDWFWETDVEHRRTYLSPNFEKVTGLNAAAYLGKRREEYGDTSLHPEGWREHLATVAARRPFRDFVFRLHHPEGKTVWQKVSGIPVFGPDGAFQGYRGTASDVTAQVEAEARLRESEERFRQLFEASSDWFWEADAELRLTYVSDNFEKMTGRSASSCLGKPREAYGDVDVDPEAWRQHMAVLQSRQPFRDFVFRLKDPGADGQALWAKVSGIPVFAAHGGFLGYRGAGSNVTAQVEAEARRRELEAQLHHSQRLEALGTLAGGIAHDLNNALVPILAMTKLVWAEMPADSATRDRLRLALDGSRRAKELVQQILAFSRKQVAGRQEFDPAAVVADCLKMLRAGIPRTITLVDELEPVLPIIGYPG
jgi:PAS domain S-box-containing protein